MFEALVEDLRVDMGSPAIGRVGARLNYEKSGMRSTMQRAGRAAGQLEPPYRETMVERDAAWGEARPLGRCHVTREWHRRKVELGFAEDHLPHIPFETTLDGGCRSGMIVPQTRSSEDTCR